MNAYKNLGLVYDFTGAFHEALHNLTIYAQLAPAGPEIGHVKTKIVELRDRLGLLEKPAK